MSTNDNSSSNGGDGGVFLGGSCNPTTWREEIAVPLFQISNVKYYNPQVEEWNESLIQSENINKNNSSILFFVINNQTRSISSMIELTELITLGRRIILVISDIRDGDLVDGAKITGRELRDLNRARKYVIDLAKRNSSTVEIYTSVVDGVLATIKSIASNNEQYQLAVELSKKINQSTTMNAKNNDELIAVGERVKAKCTGWSKGYYGVVQTINENGTYTIQFEDGEIVKNVKRRQINQEEQKLNFSVGMKVRAKFAGK